MTIWYSDPQGKQTHQGSTTTGSGSGSYASDGSGIWSQPSGSGARGSTGSGDSDDSKDHPGELPNEKKKAMWRVVSNYFDAARTTIGADYDHTGGQSPADKMINSTGVGKEGTVWKSTLAETKRAAVADALGAVTTAFNWARNDRYIEWSHESDWVDENDSRAKW